MEHRQRLAQLAKMVPGKPIHWVGKNRDGLQRYFKGRIQRMVLNSGHSFRLEVEEVNEYRGETRVKSHPGATINCFKEIQIPDDLLNANALEIREVNARVFLTEAA